MRLQPLCGADGGADTVSSATFAFVEAGVLEWGTEQRIDGMAEIVGSMS